MVLRLFGLKKKQDKAQPPADAPAASEPAAQEPVEFEETGAPSPTPAKKVNARSGGGKPSGKKGASGKKSAKSAAKKAPKKAPAKKSNQGGKTASKKR